MQRQHCILCNFFFLSLLMPSFKASCAVSFSRLSCLCQYRLRHEKQASSTCGIPAVNKRESLGFHKAPCWQRASTEKGGAMQACMCCQRAVLQVCVSRVGGLRARWADQTFLHKWGAEWVETFTNYLLKNDIVSVWERGVFLLFSLEPALVKCKLATCWKQLQSWIYWFIINRKGVQMIIT